MARTPTRAKGSAVKNEHEQRNSNGDINGANGSGNGTISAVANSAGTTPVSGNTPSSTPPPSARAKRQSAQLANLKNSMLYKPQAAALASSPAIKEKLSQEKNGESQDVRTMLKFDGKVWQTVQLRKQDGSDEFTEPELATPQPSYSGLPLESFPNAKIKKESLWPTRRRKAAPKEDSASEATDTEVALSDKEAQYKKSLQTGATESLTSDSKIRSVPRTKSGTKGGPGRKRNADTDKGGDSLTKNGVASPLRASKRIKVTSPKKSITTANLAPSAVETGSTTPNPPDDSSNDEFCSACGGSGMFICCEECPKSFHLVCCDPPLDTIPEESWICRECEYKKRKSSKQPRSSRWESAGVFSRLLNKLESLDPVEFQLPKGLRDNTFVNVGTDEHGEYDDQSFKPELSLSKLNGNQIKGFNFTRDLELDSLYNKHGEPYLCHKCGLSGLNNRVIVHCDYCPLVWHMDCLKDPLYTPKTLGTKWRCPNHYENLLPMNLFVRRNFKDTPILDVALHNHFLRIAENHNLLIKYDDQPYLDQSDPNKLPTLQEYLKYEAEEFNRFNPDYNGDRMVPKNTNTLDNRDDIHEDFKVPSFFNNYQISNAVVAKPQPSLKKMMAITELDAKDHEIKSFVYRVPEQSIILDFFTKVKKEVYRRKKGRGRKKQVPKKSVKEEIMNSINDYEQKREEMIQQENEFVENVNLFHSSPSPAESSCGNDTVQKPTVHHLIEAALGASSTHTGLKPQVSESEMTELLNIKKLIELKGKDALMKFLQS